MGKSFNTMLLSFQIDYLLIIDGNHCLFKNLYLRAENQILSAVSYTSKLDTS